MPAAEPAPNQFANAARTGFTSASLTLIAFGISFRSKNTSAIFCCSAAMAGVIGLMP